MASILKVDTIQDQSGNNIINESGDTITIGASGDTITVPTGATFSAPGIANTPAFEAKISSNQSVSDNTNTLVQFDTEEFDTDSDYDTSTYRFTPQSAGKYFVYLSLGFDTQGDSQLQNIYAFLRKNGTDIKISHNNYAANNNRFGTVNVNAVVNLNGSTDYIEARAQCADSSGNAFIIDVEYSTFGAYRLIGV